jgi:hypothetical protein
VNSSNYYSSIDDIPLYNWVKCTGGDLTYTRRNGKGSPQKDEEVWDAIYDTYITEMGLDKLYKRFLDVMRKKALIECDYVLTRDNFNLTLLDIEEGNLKAMLESAGRGGGSSVEQSLVHISKWLGSYVNSKSITAREYFIMLKEIEKVNK